MAHIVSVHDDSCTIALENLGKCIREDSRLATDTVSAFSATQNTVSANKRLHVKKRSSIEPISACKDFYVRRAREYDLISHHVNKHNCKKQLAVFVKFPDGNKYLVAFVDFFRRGKKLYGGSISPVFWYDVSTSYKRTLRGSIDVSDTLPESVMRKMLGIYEKDVHVYAQSLDSIKPSRMPTTRYEKIRQPRYRATGEVFYCKPQEA